MWLNALRVSLSMLIVWTLMAGVLYPLIVTGIAQRLFPFEASGSLLNNDQGVIVGSLLVGQPFDDPGYFWGRPSATVPTEYNSLASGGSNLEPLNPRLLEILKARIQRLKGVDSDNKALIPVDLVTASGSGLDPEISISAARYQIPRVAKVRRMDPAVIENLIKDYRVSDRFVLWTPPRVNVLELNVALERLQPK